MQEMQRLMNSSTRRQRDHDTQPAQRPQRVIAEADFERVLVSERVSCSKFYVAGVCGVQDLLFGHFCAAKLERLWQHVRYESKRVRTCGCVIVASMCEHAKSQEHQASAS